MYISRHKSRILFTSPLPLTNLGMNCPWKENKYCIHPKRLNSIYELHFIGIYCILKRGGFFMIGNKIKKNMYFTGTTRCFFLYNLTNTNLLRRNVLTAVGTDFCVLLLFLNRFYLYSYVINLKKNLYLLFYLHAWLILTNYHLHVIYLMSLM